MSLKIVNQTMASSPYINIGELRKAYTKGENITKLLSDQSPDLERQEVIEVAYDIQSGSYTEIAQANPGRLQQYAQQLHELCKDYIVEHDSLLDCGAGELTTISALSQHLPIQTRLLACDISLSRLRVGRRFAEQHLRPDLSDGLQLFVADMAYMPIVDHGVDVVFTSHALEPNHGRERHLLKELLRISRRHVILFEPSWEHANEAVRARMIDHGYVRDLPRHIEEAGGRLVSVKPLPHSLNSMNPTFCYIVETANQNSRQASAVHPFLCPRSGFPLNKQENYWWSMEGGWAYPEIEGIACLRTKHGVLMSHG
jgi:ubiquinone/menaquinone biosynthesis C-methylase UbiE